MPRVDKKKNLRPSVLDRLFDDEPYQQIDVIHSKQQQLRQLRSSVRRDLEYLLNTRYRILEPGEEFKQLVKSLLNYGLPDLATIDTIDADKKNVFTQNLEKTLQTFEPRFKSVRVRCIDNQDKTDRTLRFRINATLYADPVPEVIVFDSVLEPVSRTVNVEEAQYG